MDQAVNCDKCHTDFKMKIKKKTKAGGIEVTYFSCPKCFEKYIVSVFDAECRKMQRNIRAMRKQYQDLGHQLVNRKITNDEYISQIDSLDKKNQEMIAQLKERQRELKAETL